MDQSLKNSGWTLIELLIALAISALLMVIALPSYRSWLGEYHRQKAIVTLYTLREKMEQYYLDNAHWPHSLTEMPFTAGCVEGYQFELALDNDNLPLLSAIPSSSQLQDDPQIEQITINVKGSCEVSQVDGSVSVCQGALG